MGIDMIEVDRFEEMFKQHKEREIYFPLNSKVFSIFIFIKWLEMNTDKFLKAITRKEFQIAINYLYNLYITENNNEADKLINAIYDYDDFMRKLPRPLRNKIKNSDEKELIKLIKIISSPKYFKKKDYNLIEFFSSNIFIYLPDKYLMLFEFSQNQLMKVNETISWAWTNLKSFEIEKKLKETFSFSNTKISDSSFNCIFDSITDKKAIAKFTKENNRIILLNDFQKIFEDKLIFWTVLTNKSSLKYVPNKKYPNEMHEYTQQMIESGYKASKVYEKSLLKFSMDPLKYESYEKRFRTWKKGGSKLP